MIPAPAVAKMNMPGMTMPAKQVKSPHKALKKPTKKHATKKAQKNPAVGHKKAAAEVPMRMPMSGGSATMRTTSGGTAMPPMGSSGMGQGTMTMPMPRSSTAKSAPMVQMPMGQSPMTGMAQSSMPGMAKGSMTMGAVLGSYPPQRESSGTSWQPDTTTPIGGPMTMSGGWMLMAHGDLNLIYDHQSGPRGDDKAFASGMLMGMAQHPLRSGTVQFRAMLSPDPLMGPSGYPLLLASGETANGRDRLIDRQHPHDFFMELSATASQNVGPKSSIFLYAGLPGEPAFGPPTFMHRESIMDSPEAPITHHWLDSTHITFGVLTLGLVVDQVKIEASRFNGREPDQHRWNIETGPLDSTAIRVSWNPIRTLALQGSWAHLVEPEQLEPGVDQTRWSASAMWADDVAPSWHAAATLAWGRKSSHGHNDDGIAAEASLKHSQWTIFGRAERIENRELIQGQDQPAYRLGKISLGAVRDFPIADHLSLGGGGLFSVNFVPDALAPLYGGHNPIGAMAFLRLKLN
jgi:hypothetical protein